MFNANLIRENRSTNNKFPVIAFFVYLGVFLAPNGNLFQMKIGDYVHFTPMRLVLFILGIGIATLFLRRKLIIVPIIRKFTLLKPLMILLAIKIVSVFYSSNYLGGISFIEWFAENICLVTICYIFYVKRAVTASRLSLFIIAGFAVSVFVSILQIRSVIFGCHFFSCITDYVARNTAEANLYRISGLYRGDVNCYATYIVSVLLFLCGMTAYVKEKYVPALGMLCVPGTIVLYSLQSRSAILIGAVTGIYLVIKEKALGKKSVYAFIFLFVLCVVFAGEFCPGARKTFIKKMSVRYFNFITYVTNKHYSQENSVQAHARMVSMYGDIVINDPFAVLVGCGEGDYLGKGGRSEKGRTGAHNAYVLVLGENGPIALLIFVYITWLILKTAFFVHKNSSIIVARFFFYVIVAYILSFAVYGSQFHAYFFWIILGFTFAESTRIGMATHGVKLA